MKRTTSFGTLLAVATLSCLTVSADAGQVRINNPGSGYRGLTGGGEFRTYLSDGLVQDALGNGYDIMGAYFDDPVNGAGGPDGTRNIGGAGPTGFSNSVMTFCLERTDYFGWNTTYNADLNTEAIVGGDTLTRRGGSATNDPLSLGTAWLISTWASGDLDDVASSLVTYDATTQPSGTLDRRDSARIIQNTIWFLEHELLPGELNTTRQGEVNALLAIIQSETNLSNTELFEDNYVNGMFTFNALAINIGSPTSDPQYRRQDQLVAFIESGNNVPDGGASAALLGLALCGIGVARRCSRKK